MLTIACSHSWAGRAFQRAISAHVGQQKQRDAPRRKADASAERIDLAISSDVIDVDVGDDNGEEDSDAKSHGQVKAVGVRADENDSFPEQRNPPRKPDLFDTSLEGLNNAHKAIMEEEKAMERDMSTITDEMKEDILSLLR